MCRCRAHRRRAAPIRPAPARSGPALVLVLALLCSGCHREQAEEGSPAMPPPASEPGSAAGETPGPATRGLPAPLPGARLVLAGRARMGSGPREERCGAYRLITDSPDPSLLDLCRRLAPEVDRLVEERYGLVPVGKPAGAILLFARNRDFRAFAAEDAGLAAGYGGLTLASRSLLALPVEGVPPRRLATTLAHELTHLVERRTLGPNLPPWLSEGLADGIGDTATPDGFLPLAGFRGVEAQAERLRFASRQNRARSLRELLALDRPGFDRPAAGAPVAYDYEHSALLVRYLLADPARATAFRAYLASVATGTPPTPDLLPAALGVGWEELEAGFRGWLGEG